MDRNLAVWAVEHAYQLVALRKESVDRNCVKLLLLLTKVVALRKESVDRNLHTRKHKKKSVGSLSARRAWIEIF